MDIILRAVDVHKVYRMGDEDLDVLRGVSLDVRKGDFIAITGPSGVGKSTLLHIMGGLDRPTRGAVSVRETDIYKLNDRKRSQFRSRSVGFVFQFYHLLPEFTALENVMLPALAGGEAGSADVKSRAEKLLGDVGLAARSAHRPGQMSGGEQQRVAIARALMNGPDLLLADEPTGNLDSHNSKVIIDLLVRLNREQGQTTVIVTHDERIASQMKRVIRMLDGNIIDIRDN